MDENNKQIPAFIIKADGRRLSPEQDGAVLSISVDDCLDGLSRFRIVFDGAALEGGCPIEPGSEVAIWLGYENGEAEVFTGDALELCTRLTGSGGGHIELGGCSVLHRLGHSSRRRSLEGKKPSEAVKALLQGYSLEAEMEDFGDDETYRAEEGASDYDYLMKQAAAYGKHVYASGRKVYIKDEITVHADEIVYEWGKSLLSIDLHENHEGLISGVAFLGWDSQKNQTFAGQAEFTDLPVKVGGGAGWSAEHTGGMAAVDVADYSGGGGIEDARDRAIGYLQRRSFELGQASGKAEGDNRLKPGMRVSIKMVREPFEGEYMAYSVQHRFDRNGGYTTAFELMRNTSGKAR